jgi:lipopolysaccharide/colanic/teichoic acid biosynthesis glycosyltransferase
MIPYRHLKRCLDIAGAVIVLAGMSPVLGATALLVRTSLGRPILFTQERPGLDGRVFTLYKFRSMRAEHVESGLVTDQQRLTPFGTWLRSTSLDELPSMINVLKGDMSIVGPRPLLVSYLERYSPEQARRHEVRPGITGLAQVSGRNAVSWEERFKLDIQYVDTLSFRNDLRILWRTVGAVLLRRGISAAGEATMPEFTGTPERPQK